MQYGSIGWSVGATLGYAQAAQDKRVIACIGDGSFQVNIVPLLIVYILFTFLVRICKFFRNPKYKAITLSNNSILV